MLTFVDWFVVSVHARWCDVAESTIPDMNDFWTSWMSWTGCVHKRYREAVHKMCVCAREKPKWLMTSELVGAGERAPSARCPQAAAQRIEAIVVVTVRRGWTRMDGNGQNIAVDAIDHRFQPILWAKAMNSVCRWRRQSDYQTSVDVINRPKQTHRRATQQLRLDKAKFCNAFDDS